MTGSFLSGQDGTIITHPSKEYQLGKNVDVKVKTSKDGYTASFNGPYSHNVYSAIVELDSDYNFKSAVINRGDDKIEIPVLEFSDDKVDIPSIVTKTINEYKTEQ